ncbi:acetyl-CoA synthetase-like protein [Gautieria morchelliformis]|nr:acetyl-CoA synthetase-like protein [Gautieria morchelliformis]
MPSTFVHFEALRARMASHPDTPIFKLPKPGAHGREWVNVSYKDFHADIERMAKYWLAKLASQGLPPRSVVGIWLRGFTYSDVITTFAISRAGFVPQMFGFELPNTRIVYELLVKGAGKAIVHDPAKTTLLREFGTTLPCYAAPDYTTISHADIAFPLPDLPPASPEDYVFIYHSSGSVSGMPKVIPKTNQWLATIEHKSREAFCLGDFDGQDVFVWTESFSHSMEICLFQLILHRAGCLVQPTRIDFDSPELATMIRITGVNRIIQFTGVLRRHLEDARGGAIEPGLLALLKQARQVTYAGMPLATELEDWAVAQGIPMTNNFGCTECGQLLTSDIGDRRLRMLPNISYKMVPVGPTPISIDGADYEYGRLLELWILPDSPDLPIPALRTPDGGWRSGDLFEEPEPGTGKYLFRGRDDDWIKSQWCERLDTKAIEDNVYTTCADIVTNCVVVGNGRPFPALFVEPRVPMPAAAATPSAELELKREIIRRTSDFHSLRYLHERIQDVRMIKIVPAKALPRTAAKGNIRRRAVEHDFARDLEAMYASFPHEEVYAGVLSAPAPKGTGKDVSSSSSTSSERGPAQTLVQVGAASVS